MKYELEKLEELVIGLLAENENGVTYETLKEESWRTEKAIIHNLLLQRNETLLKTYFTIHVQKLVELCDRLFDARGLPAGRKEINLLLDLLGAVKKSVPGLLDRNIALLKPFRIIQGEVLKKQWQTLSLKFQELNFTPELATIIGDSDDLDHSVPLRAVDTIPSILR